MGLSEGRKTGKLNYEISFELFTLIRDAKKSFYKG
jgi:hypothetical protein